MILESGGSTSTTMDKEHHENSWRIHSFSVGRYDRSGILLTYVKTTILDHDKSLKHIFF